MQVPDRAPDEIDFLSIDDDTGEVKILERWALTPEEKARIRDGGGLVRFYASREALDALAQAAQDDGQYDPPNQN